MATLDIIILAVLLFGAVRGYMRGLLASLFSLCGLFVGLFFAYCYNEQLGVELAPFFHVEPRYSRIITFILIWVVAASITSILGKLLTQVLNVLCLGFLNRMSGACLGAAKYFVAMTCFVALLNYTGIARQQRAESRACQVMQRISAYVFK